jgi:hypothetical protein
MALDLNGNGLDTPPPSSTASAHEQSKPVAAPRQRTKDKHGKRKERVDQQIPSINTLHLPHANNNFPFPPLSPVLTSTSGHSTAQDSRRRYRSPSPLPTPRTATSRNVERAPEVYVVIDDVVGSGEGERSKFSNGLVDRRGVGSAVVKTTGSGWSSGKKVGLVEHKKRKEREPEPSATRPSGFGLMAMPKKVTTYESRPAPAVSSTQHAEHQHKRPRLEIATTNHHTQHQVKDNSRPHQAASHISNHHVKPSQSPATSAASKVLKLTLKKPIPVLPKPSTAGDRHAPLQLASTTVTKTTTTKTIVATKTVSKRKGPKKDVNETEAAKRLRLKDPIKYYAKKRPDGTIIDPPARTPKSKGKAVRKKINAPGEGSVVRSRLPSPFPAYHRTTQVLDRYGVPPIPERKVKKLPADNCYVLIPSTHRRLVST